MIDRVTCLHLKELVTHPVEFITSKNIPFKLPCVHVLGLPPQPPFQASRRQRDGSPQNLSGSHSQVKAMKVFSDGGKQAGWK